MQQLRIQDGWLDRIPIRRRLSFERDAVIASSRDIPGDTIQIVLKGSVRVSLVTTDGRERILINLTEGGLFGEQASFSHLRLPSDLTVLANVQCTIGHVATADILEALRNEPRLFIDIMRITAEKTSLLLQELERSAFGTAQSQIANILLTLAHPDGSVPLTQERLAQISGKTRVTVGMQLHQLEALGAIRLERSKVVIVDPQTLASYRHPSDPGTAGAGGSGGSS